MGINTIIKNKKEEDLKNKIETDVPNISNETLNNVDLNEVVNENTNIEDNSNIENEDNQEYNDYYNTIGDEENNEQSNSENELSNTIKMSSAFQDLLSASETITKLKNGKVTDLPLNILKKYPNHPYEVYDDKKMKILMDSINRIGLAQPIVVLKTREYSKKGEEEYIILSGHHRVEAYKRLGFAEITAYIKENLTKEEQEMIVNESNLVQRSFNDCSTLEKCLALHQTYQSLKRYYDQREAEMRQRHRDIPNWCSRDRLGEEYGLGSSTVSIYLKIYEVLCKNKEYHKYVQMVDDKKIQLMLLYEIIKIGDKKPDYDIILMILENVKIGKWKLSKHHIEEIKNMYDKEQEINEEIIEGIINTNIEDTKQLSKMKISPIKFKNLLEENMTQFQVEERIQLALTEYNKNHLIKK